jgi:hypothetical protein
VRARARVCLCACACVPACSLQAHTRTQCDGRRARASGLEAATHRLNFEYVLGKAREVGVVTGLCVVCLVCAHAHTDHLPPRYTARARRLRGSSASSSISPAMTPTAGGEWDAFTMCAHPTRARTGMMSRRRCDADTDDADVDTARDEGDFAVRVYICEAVYCTSIHSPSADSIASATSQVVDGRRVDDGGVLLCAVCTRARVVCIRARHRTRHRS